MRLTDDGQNLNAIEIQEKAFRLWMHTTDRVVYPITDEERRKLKIERPRVRTMFRKALQALRGKEMTQ